MKRILILVSFMFRTGNQTHRESRLVVVNQNEGEGEEALSQKATGAFVAQFGKYYPESTLLSAIAHPTIDGTDASPGVDAPAPNRMTVQPEPEQDPTPKDSEPVAPAEEPQTELPSGPGN